LLQLVWLTVVQTPVMQAWVVHWLPSVLQEAPSPFAGFEQCPVPGSHVPAVWHESGCGQLTVLCAVHTPLLHASTVHALPSVSQLVPLPFSGFEHVPVLGLHEPAVWHWSGVGHVTVLCAEQTPVLQTSTVHALLSVSQLVPFAFIG
jgi:hypothetical protein